MPWGRLHEGISVLWETTFAFQRAKPIVVSPFENPFPTRGRGPWTPRGAAVSRWFLRIPSTGRDAPTASCSVLGFCWHRVAFRKNGKTLATLESRQPTLTVIPSEWNESRDLHAGIAAALVERALRGSQNVIRCQKSLQHRAAGGWCIAAGRWYAKAPPPAPSPPWGPGAAAPGQEGVLKG